VQQQDELEDILSEVAKAKQILHDLTYTLNLKRTQKHRAEWWLLEYKVSIREED
jgi:hypothetical protein